MKTSLAGLGLSLFLLALAAPAPAREFAEDMLQKYAAAQQEIRIITEDYRARVEESDPETTTEERVTREHAYQRRLSKAVEDAGLTPRQYNEIQAEALRDQTLQRRIEAMMK